MRWLSLGMTAGVALGAVGCKTELPGAYWDLEQRTIDDQCNTPTISGSGGFEYRVVYDLQDITVAIGDDEFAFGTVSGCTLDYQTVVWPEEREGLEIAWQMTGTALVRRGENDSCEAVDGKDWVGTETFEIVTAPDNPDLQPGCTYTVEVTGTFLEEITEKGAKEEEQEEPLL